MILLAHYELIRNEEYTGWLLNFSSVAIPCEPKRVGIAFQFDSFPILQQRIQHSISPCDCDSDDDDDPVARKKDHPDRYLTACNFLKKITNKVSRFFITIFRLDKFFSVNISCYYPKTDLESRVMRTRILWSEAKKALSRRTLRRPKKFHFFPHDSF